MPSGCLLPMGRRGCLHPEVPEAHEAWKDLGNFCLQICGLLVLRQGLVLWQKQVAMSRGWCAMSAPLLYSLLCFFGRLSSGMGPVLPCAGHSGRCWGLRGSCGLSPWVPPRGLQQRLRKELEHPARSRRYLTGELVPCSAVWRCWGRGLVRGAGRQLPNMKPALGG